MAARFDIRQIGRHVSKEGADYYPTPPWATRALMEDVLPDVRGPIWEPACGGGHMAETLREYGPVYATDLHDYGYGEQEDFLASKRNSDWIITNPPFTLALEFALHARERANLGFALLARLQLLEGKARYEKLFSRHAISCYPFVERIGFQPGKWDPSNDRGVTAFAWFVWRVDAKTSKLGWIPPGCRDRYTREDDRRWLKP